MQFVLSDLHRMPRGRIGVREIDMDKEECKTVSLRFRCLLLKCWLWLQIYHFKLYYYMRSSDSIKSRL